MSINWAEPDVNILGAIIRGRGIETDLSNADLVGYARAAIDEIAARGLGPQAAFDFVLYGNGGTLLTLPRQADSVSAITEEGSPLSAGTDYRLRNGGLFLERIRDNYPYGWRGRITGTIAASTSNDRYDRVVIDLVKLALQYTGLDSQRDGDYAEEAAGARGGGLNSYQMQRDQIISELAPAGVGFA